MAFATAAELSEFVGETVSLLRATRVLDMASAAVAGAAGVPIALVTDDMITVDGSGGLALLLPSWPVVAVTSVKVDSVAVDPAGWAWSRTGVLERVGALWPVKKRAVQVTYTHGYAPSELPAEVKTVTLQVAARLAANPYSLSQESIGNYSRSWTTSTQLTDAEREMLGAALR